jgi:DNA-binding transcriptional MerR regulator
MVRFVSEMVEIPQKRFYKISEVCQYTDTQPYVVRFWESEFPQLQPDKSRSGQSVYSRRDIELILRIKELLYDEEYTLDGARRRLAEEKKRRRKGKSSRAKAKSPPARKKAAAAKPAETPNDAPAKPSRSKAPARAIPPHAALEFDTVARERYEDAVDEISHMRLQLREFESKERKAEGQLDKLRRTTEDYRQRCEKAVIQLEKLLERLEG